MSNAPEPTERPDQPPAAQPPFLEEPAKGEPGPVNESAPTVAPTPAPEPAAEANLPPEVEITPDIDREVAEAMAAMSADELALLGAETAVTGPGAPPEQIEPGTELTGTVVGVTQDDVFLDLGTKLQGVLPRNQFGKKEPVENGRRVDVVVDRFDEESRLLNVIRKGQIQRATWENLARGNLVEGRVVGLNKGGLEVDLKGIRAFMPASQVDVVPRKDISELLNEVVRCEVMEVDRRGNNILLSRRKVLEKERTAAREHLLEDLQVGQTRKGTVGNITDFGAFVNLGGVDGLVHISDMSWGSVEKVSDVLSPGQEVEVKVLKVDLKRNRISLGMKQALPDPWEGVGERYPVGTQLKARVVRLADFGVFAELESGVEGLVPISEMGWSRVQRTSDLVSAGDMIDVVVIRVELPKRRIALSMKQAQADPWAGVLESFTPQSLVKGKVTRLADFGAFVELAPGIEGLVHISEMADRRVRSCSEVVEPGQEIEVRVLGVDGENRRISLSIRAVTAAQTGSEQDGPAAEPARKERKKRKKPLRGGVSWEWGG